MIGFAVAPNGACEPAGTEGTEQPPSKGRRHRPGMIGSTADFRGDIKPFVPSWPTSKPNATEADLEEVQQGDGQQGGDQQGGQDGAPPPAAILEGGKAGPEGPNNLTPEPSGPYAADVCGDPGPDPEPLQGDPGMGEDVAGLYTVVRGEREGRRQVQRR